MMIRMHLDNKLPVVNIYVYRQDVIAKILHINSYLFPSTYLFLYSVIRFFKF
jgi:hypothetical protein